MYRREMLKRVSTASIGSIGVVTTFSNHARAAGCSTTRRYQGDRVGSTDSSYDIVVSLNDQDPNDDLRTGKLVVYADVDDSSLKSERIEATLEEKHCHISSGNCWWPNQVTAVADTGGLYEDEYDRAENQNTWNLTTGTYGSANEYRVKIYLKTEYNPDYYDNVNCSGGDKNTCKEWYTTQSFDFCAP